MTKYIFVTGGVVSSLGKGITAASLGRLLKSRGYKVTIQKFDPYINVDPGTMSPYQHGEVPLPQNMQLPCRIFYPQGICQPVPFYLHLLLCEASYL